MRLHNEDDSGNSGCVVDGAPDGFLGAGKDSNKVASYRGRPSWQIDGV
jgi:hypothetical protein